MPATLRSADGSLQPLHHLMTGAQQPLGLHRLRPYTYDSATCLFFCVHNSFGVNKCDAASSVRGPCRSAVSAYSQESRLFLRSTKLTQLGTTALKKKCWAHTSPLSSSVQSSAFDPMASTRAAESAARHTDPLHVESLDAEFDDVHFCTLFSNLLRLSVWLTPSPGSGPSRQPSTRVLLTHTDDPKIVS